MTVRMMLSLSVKQNMALHHLDVKTAFLNSHFDEEVYMKQPEGFVQTGQENLVCKRKRTIYGLKEASRQWYQELDSFLM